MAQVCGESLHDFDWDRKLDLVLLRVREAADAWAIGATGAPSAELLGAALLKLLRSTWPRTPFATPQAWKMRLADWVAQAGNFKEELRRLQGRQHIRGDPNEVAERLLGIFDQAIESWAGGHPERPPTRQVVAATVQLLFDAKLVPHAATANWRAEP